MLATKKDFVSRQGFDKLNHQLDNHQMNQNENFGKPDYAKTRPCWQNELNDENLDEPEMQTARGRTKVCRTLGRFRTKHLRRIKTWEREYNLLCGAVADERETRCINRATHAAFFAGCVGNAETYKVDVKEQSYLQKQSQAQSADQRCIWFCTWVA